jgi:hypothetical protein
LSAVRGRPITALASACATARYSLSPYVSPTPVTPPSVSSSTTHRGVYGWWTPRTLSRGGSPIRTGVTVARAILGVEWGMVRLLSGWREWLHEAEALGQQRVGRLEVLGLPGR